MIVSTYNHERYIHQALESIVQQVTSFPFEIVVIDDNSQDATPSIIREFAARYPDVVKPVLGTVNLGDHARLSSAYSESSASYVCIVDGDDYWTSPHKLAHQCAFLDEHVHCSMAFHAVTVLEQDRARSWVLRPPATKPFFELHEILGEGFIASCSVMLRRAALSGFPSWFVAFEVGDWAINILAAERGAVGYIDEVMAVYRRHSGGYWSGLLEEQRILRKLTAYRQLNAYTGGRYGPRMQSVLDSAESLLWEEFVLRVKRADWRGTAAVAWSILRQQPLWFVRMLTRGRSSDTMNFHRRPWRHRAWNRLLQLLPSFRSPQGIALEGTLDKADARFIYGWAWYRARRDLPVMVRLYGDDKFIGQFKADRYRQDLAEAGKADGYCAFRVPTPEWLKDGGRHEVRAEAATSGQPLANSPITVAIDSA